MVNVCDQVVERSSKILTQRSKAGASEHITIEELQNVHRFMEILNSETSAMTGKTITGNCHDLREASLVTGSTSSSAFDFRLTLMATVGEYRQSIFLTHYFASEL